MAEFSIRIGHLEGIESPWANSGGVIKTTQDVEAMSKTGVGWIEDGSQTLLGRPGNAVDPNNPELGPVNTVYTHNSLTGETGNSLGIPGLGLDVVEVEVPERVRISELSNKKYVLNVAPVSNEPIDEAFELVSRGYSKGAHAVLLNAGCPNVISEDGSRHELLSRNPKTLALVLDKLKVVVDKYEPVFIRISPQESYDHAREIFKVIRDSRVVSAVFTPNTWPGYKPLDDEGQPILQVKDGIGGKSGPATAEDSLEQTIWAVELLEGSNIDVVSSSGIMNARELKIRLGHRAVAGAGTTFYYESVNGWVEDTDKLLKELAS